MAETNLTVAPRKRRGWPLMLGLVFGILLILTAVTWFVVTSPAFFKGVILPKVGASMNSEVTVSDASISPFKSVVLKNLKVTPKGQETLLTVADVTLRYSLMDIIRGNIRVDLVSVDAPVIRIIEKPDGSMNLDPIIEGQSEQTPESGEASKRDDKPLRIDIRKVAVNNATLEYVKVYGVNNRDTMRVSDFNLTLEDLKNDFTGKISYGGQLAMDNNPPSPGTNGSVAARLEGTHSFSLTRELEPVSVQGNSRLAVTKATGALAIANGMLMTFDTDITPTEVKQVALRLGRGQARLGEILARGPFDMKKVEGRVTVDVLGVDKNALNVMGAPFGLDFGSTRISSTNQIQVFNRGKAIQLAGAFNVSQMQITMTNQTTPPLDFRADYDLVADIAANSNIVRVLAVSGSQNGRPILTGQLTRPMVFAPGQPNASSDSSFTATVDQIRLADWKPLLGGVASSGTVSGKLAVDSKQAGNLLLYELRAEVSDLTVLVDTNQLSQLSASFGLRGSGTNMTTFVIPAYSFRLTRQNESLISAEGSVGYDLKGVKISNENFAPLADIRVSGQMVFAPFLQAIPVEGLSLKSGGADFKLKIAQSNEVQSVTGTMAARDLTGSYMESPFRNLTSTMDLNVESEPSKITIRSIAGKVSENGQAGGAFDLSGLIDQTDQSTQLTTRLNDLNQNALRAFMEPFMPGQKLLKLSVNGLASIATEQSGLMVIKADFAATNLVVSNSVTRQVQAPLQAGTLLDATIRSNLFELRQAQLMFAPTPRATNNSMTATGKVDMRDPNAYTGAIKLTADTLDMTQFYNLFAGNPTVTPPGGTPAPAPPATAQATAATPATEPEPIEMPLTNFVAEANVNRFYVRELEITNLATTVKLDRGRTVIKPFTLSLNGAPVMGIVDLDLGVRGWRYLVNFGMTNVPFAPLVSTFVPEKKGQMGGTLTASTSVKGAGITMASMQTNLAGAFHFGTANLNFSISQSQSKLLRKIVDVIAILPELKKNPNAAIGSLTGTLTGTRSLQGSAWIDELTQAPIDIMALSGAIGNGYVVLDNSLIQSSSFQAMAKGTVQLKADVTNSVLNIPLSVALRRPLAEKINFVPRGTPTNMVYVRLPDYVTIKGTIEEPKADINARAVMGSALEQIGNIPGVDSKTGNLIQGLGGLLGGGRQPQGVPSGSSTNVPASPTATNSPAGQNLMQGLRNLLGGPTNAPAAIPGKTNAPGTNVSPSGVGGLLNQILNPGTNRAK